MITLKKSLATIMLVMAAFVLLAQIPKTLSFQGVLIDPNTDQAVADNSYNFIFRIFNVQTGGTALWTESQSLATENGRYDAILGSITPIDLDGTESYWLEVEVESTILGRTKLTSSAYILDDDLEDLANDGSLKKLSINSTGDAPDAASLLDVKSTDKGVLIPRMTSSQRDAISSPPMGLMIFNTSRKCTEWYTGIEWQSAVPAGTIKAFGGTTVPDGWLLCNGVSVSTTTYSDLYAAIGNNFGGDASNIYLPDLRGRFLRGQDQGTGRDEDAASRIASNSAGNTGDNIGSYQADATSVASVSFGSNNTGAHTHSLSGTSGSQTTSHGIPIRGYNPPSNSGQAPFGTRAASVPLYPWLSTVSSGDESSTNIMETTSDSHTHSISGTAGSNGNHSHTITGSGDNETRPENVAVRFIIKY